MHEHQLNPPKADILVVDDSPDNLRLLAGILAEQNYKVRPASDGELALEFARSTPPDLILLDIKMPGMDGYAVCETLKADERTRDIPVIFISALDEVFDKVKAFALGGVDYITKPYQPEEVLARVETHVTLCHYRKHLEEIVEERSSELKYAYNRYRAFIKNSSEGIWRVEFERPIDLELPEDEQFELVYKHAYIAEANDAYARSVGFTHGEELVGKKIEAFAPRSVPRNVESIKALIRGRYTITDAETIESYKDGITRNILNNSVGIIEDGRVVRVWGTHRDITAQREIEQGLRQSKDFNQAVLMSLPDHIAVLDRQGTILTVNASWIEFARENDLGSLERIGSGVNYLEVCRQASDADDETARLAAEGIESVIKGRRERFELEYPCHAPTEPRWFLMSVVPFTGSKGGVIVSHSNITARKQAEQQLKTAYTEIQTLKKRLQEENIYLQEEIQQIHHVENIVGQHSSMTHALYKVKEIAPTDMTVLILGETGTGKELFARAVHRLSSRNDRALVKVNCAALPTTLIESELFGHEKGAFTGADQKRKGRFELADGASLFLDEIGELPLELQAKLLQVLQNGEFERLGGNKTLTVDVRIIAATNRHLATEVQQGRFRKDLYYRLNKYRITIPPLRDRPEDIPLLVTHAIKEVERKLGKQIRTIPPSVMQTLQDYSWPGNVRELENVIERAVLAAQGDTLYLPPSFQESDLTSEPSLPSESEERPATKKLDAIVRRGTLEEVEREYLQQILEECYWRIAGPKGAAVILGLNPSTLRARLHKLGLQRPSN